MRSLLTIFIASFLLGFVQADQSELAKQGWILEKTDEKVSAWTRPVANYSINEFRTQCEIEASISTLITILMDSPFASEWVSNVEKSVMLQKASDFKWYTQVFVDLPWPISNRDIVTSSTMTIDTARQTVIVAIKSEPNFIADHEDYLRMQNVSGKWEFRRIKPGVTEVTYTMLADPGGAVPSSLVNVFIVDGPVDNMINLRKAVKKPHYAKARLPYLMNW